MSGEETAGLKTLTETERAQLTADLDAALGPEWRHRYTVLPAGEVVHWCPPDGAGGVMPCCGRTPFEVPRYHRLTEHPGQVTCRGNPPPACTSFDCDC